MCLKCFWLKVEHVDISESSSDWAEQRFHIEIWAKSEAGGAYSGGAYIKKACMSIFQPIRVLNPRCLENIVVDNTLRKTLVSNEMMTM